VKSLAVSLVRFTGGVRYIYIFFFLSLSLSLFLFDLSPMSR